MIIQTSPTFNAPQHEQLLSIVGYRVYDTIEVYYSDLKIRPCIMIESFWDNNKHTPYYRIDLDTGGNYITIITSYSQQVIRYVLNCIINNVDVLTDDLQAQFPELFV